MSKTYTLCDVIAVAQYVIIDDNAVLAIEHKEETNDLWMHVEGQVTYCVKDASQLITLDKPMITVQACIPGVSEIQPTPLSFYMKRYVTNKDLE